MHVLLIDDHALFRRGLALLLTSLNPAVELQEASDLEVAGALARRTFDLVLVDLHMPRLAGLDALIKARMLFEDSPVAVLSSEEDPTLILRAIEIGAVGFIPKSSTPEVLQQALGLILAGGVFLPAHALRGAVPALAESPPARPDGLASLSPRQREVLLRAVQGKPNKTIARELDVSEGTVKAHLSAAFRVLKVRNRVEAVYAAARNGVVIAPSSVSR